MHPAHGIDPREQQMLLRERDRDISMRDVRERAERDREAMMREREMGGGLASTKFQGGRSVHKRGRWE